MTDVLEDAVDALERKLFLERLNRRFEELRDDPASWAEIEGERGVEERSLPAG